MICIACTQPFLSTNPRQKYCSRKCLKKIARQKQYAKRPTQVCNYCSGEFQPHAEKEQVQRFCSKRCGLLHRWNSPEYIASIPDRFWSHVKKSDGCWEWKSYRRKKGYGEFSVSGDYVLAHRYSWALHYGSITPDVLVCHNCDNPSCIRPDHLFIGTHQDNVDDMVGKSRQVQGAKSHSSKLTSDDIRAIRASALGTRALGRQYGVSHSTIGAIIHRRKWKHIG